VRQSVNFEDDNGALLEAGLLGAAFTAPFAVAGVRSSRRLAAVAEKEHQVLQAFRAVDEGAPLTPDQGKLLQEVHTAHKALNEFEAGRLDEDGLAKALDDLHGPQEPAEQWLQRYSEQLRADTKAIINDQGGPGGHQLRSRGEDLGGA
jgi:hypothetical protein